MDVSTSGTDGTVFLSVPLAAQVFGRKKLDVSALKSAVQADMQLLQAFGPTQRPDLRHGLERHLRRIASMIAEHPEVSERYRSILEFIARNHRAAWLILARLHDEAGEIAAAKTALRQYIESAGQAAERHTGWERLARLCTKSDDFLGEVHALVELCEIEQSPWSQVSNTANRLNFLFRQWAVPLDSDEKRVLVRRLIAIARRRIGEADATDCSRIAWLCLHAKDETIAREFVNRGLLLDPNHVHCDKLAKKLQIS